MSVCVVALAAGAGCKSKPHDAPAPPPPAVASGSVSGSASGSAAVRTQTAIDVAAIKNLPLTAAVAQGIPQRSIAFVDDTGVVVARLDVAGVHGVARGPRADRLQWSGDGKTLVALSGGTRAARAIVVTAYVDGASTTVDVPTTVGPPDGSPLPEAELGLAAGGEVWLRRCRDAEQIVVDPDHRVGCKDRAYRRLAPVSPADSETTTPPAGFTTVVDVAPDAHVDAPADYEVRPLEITDQTVDAKGKPLTAKRTNRAWTCNGPSGRTRWPTDDDLASDETYTGKTVTWIRADPPLYRVTGTWTGPMGDKTPSTELLLACDPKPFAGFVDGGAGLWAHFAEDPPPEVFDASYRPHGSWTLRLGATPIAAITGEPAFAIAPAPAPGP